MIEHWNLQVAGAEEHEIRLIMKSKFTLVNYSQSFQIIHKAEESERVC